MKKRGNECEKKQRDVCMWEVWSDAKGLKEI